MILSHWKLAGSHENEEDFTPASHDFLPGGTKNFSKPPVEEKLRLTTRDEVNFQTEISLLNLLASPKLSRECLHPAVCRFYSQKQISATGKHYLTCSLLPNRYYSNANLPESPFNTFLTALK